MRRSPVILLIVLLASSAFAEAPAPKLSDVLRVPRPAAGEYLGLYLMGKKVGYLYTLVKQDGETVVAINEIHFRAQVGSRTSERNMKETRTYEAKPNGRLLSFVVEQKGDGGDQVLEATTSATGIRVLRKRPDMPNETLSVKPSHEVVEDSDQARVALLRGATVEGTITDGSDLEQYKVTTTVGGGAETRSVRGVKVTVRKVVTLSEKEKVPTEAWVDDKGRMVEVHFGPTMTALAEPEDIARRLDAVEVFGLTRVVLPRPPPPNARAVPGQLKLVMVGLPEKFRSPTYRQTFKDLPHGEVEVTIRVEPPKKHSPRPLVDPNGGANLKSTIIVEADNPDIKVRAKKLAGDEKDAYAVAKKISKWVGDNMTKDYGASADRASDVLKQMKGDCTEHALLTVALLRAVGIPARRVDGVVYVMNDDQVPALYWHEWVEAYVGEWTQLDPTFGQDVADATHFAVGEEGNAEITPLIGSLKVTEIN